LMCKMDLQRNNARLAQLVERRHDMADVVGSSPTSSTILSSSISNKNTFISTCFIA
jgi:hypothetical protein